MPFGLLVTLLQNYDKILSKERLVLLNLQVYCRRLHYEYFTGNKRYVSSTFEEGAWEGSRVSG